MMAVFLGIAVVSIIYLIHAGYMDVKERMIYSTPVIFLTIIWSSYLLLEGHWSGYELAAIWLSHLICYLLMNRLHIWGAGDSDLFLLFANIVLLQAKENNLYQTVMFECIALIIAMVISLAIGAVEFKLKHKKWELKGKVAVVPGFSVVMVLMLISAFRWRWM